MVGVLAAGAVHELSHRAMRKVWIGIKPPTPASPRLTSAIATADVPGSGRGETIVLRMALSAIVSAILLAVENRSSCKRIALLCCGNRDVNRSEFFTLFKLVSAKQGKSAGFVDRFA